MCRAEMAQGRGILLRRKYRAMGAFPEKLQDTLPCGRNSLWLKNVPD